MNYFRRKRPLPTRCRDAATRNQDRETLQPPAVAVAAVAAVAAECGDCAADVVAVVAWKMSPRRAETSATAASIGPPTQSWDCSERSNSPFYFSFLFLRIF